MEEMKIMELDNGERVNPYTCQTEKTSAFILNVLKRMQDEKLSLVESQMVASGIKNCVEYIENQHRKKIPFTLN